MRYRIRAILLGVALTLPGIRHDARAATDTESLTVKAVVQLSCSLSAATLDFGTYTAGQTTELKAQATIGYSSCPASQVKLELDGGQSKNAAARAMINGTSKLNYQLYSDSGRTKPLGTGTAALAFTTAATGTGTVAVYGSIAAGQIVPAGSYTDTVGILLTF